MIEGLPQAVRPFVDFPQILRAHRFAVAPDQTVGFIEAVGLLGPGSMNDIYQAARAMLAIPKERETEFDALFRAYFLGQTIAAPAGADQGDDDVEAHEPGTGDIEVREDDEGQEDVGAEAVRAERLAARAISVGDDTEALARFSRMAPGRLPRRRSYRFERARNGVRFDLRRTLREAVRRDGEPITLIKRRRRTRQRRILLLLDVSGSMKAQTDPMMRLAHALVQVADRREVFTLGTRLTRVTPALAVQNRELALERAGRLVADIDGGTRIGDALQAFLAVPRYAGFARGAAIVIVSDGLERGSPDAFVDAVSRLSRLAWRLDWLSPLASDQDFVPETQALRAVLPMLDRMSAGGDIDAVTQSILTLSRAA